MSNLSIPSPTSFTCRRFHCVHRDVSVCTAVQVRYLHFCEKGGCNTQGSHVITHRSTNWACRCLTSQIGRDGVLSPEYGRIRLLAHATRPLSHDDAESSSSSSSSKRRGNRGLTVRILALQASGPGSTPGGCTFAPREKEHPWQDSNLQPPDPWSGALPLSHTDSCCARFSLPLGPQSAKPALSLRWAHQSNLGRTSPHQHHPDGKCTSSRDRTGDLTRVRRAS